MLHFSYRDTLSLFFILFIVLSCSANTYMQPLMNTIINFKKSKTRKTKENIEDAMLEKGYRRDCCIIAIGGGVHTYSHKI